MPLNDCRAALVIFVIIYVLFLHQPADQRSVLNGRWKPFVEGNGKSTHISCTQKLTLPAAIKTTFYTACVSNEICAPQSPLNSDVLCYSMRWHDIDEAS